MGLLPVSLGEIGVASISTRLYEVGVASLLSVSVAFLRVSLSEGDMAFHFSKLTCL